MNEYLSIITLTVKGINAPIKRHRVAEWIRKHGFHKFWLQEIYLRKKDLHKLKVKVWKKIFKGNEQGNSWNNICIRQNRLQNKGHKKRHRKTVDHTHGKNPSRTHKQYKNMCTHHRSTWIYEKNLGGPQERYRQQNIYSRAFWHHSVKNRYSKQNTSKNIAALNNTLDQMDLTDIYRTFHPMEAKYKFFGNAHGTLSKIDHMTRHTQKRVNKFKTTDIRSRNFSNHKGLKRENQPQGKKPQTIKFMEIE